jgi:biotin transporter BioY
MEKSKNLTILEALIPKSENKVLNLAKEILLIFSFAILTGLCAQIKFEIGLVPITFQTFAVLLSGALLGARKGALSQLSYLLMGLIGVPWFARGGGVNYILSPTFGYILGFVIASFLVGFLCEKGFDRKILTSLLAMLIGNIVIYLPGLFWLARFVGINECLKVGFYPFILGDLLKIILAGIALPLFWKIIKGRE